MYSKIARALGLPGGPCHVLRDLQDARLPEQIRQELQQTLEEGQDLSNSEANLLYQPQYVNTKVKLCPRILLTAHAQYRMNARGVTIADLRVALDEFERWYKARKKNMHRLDPDARRILEKIAYGRSVKFTAQRSKLTIVFQLEGEHSRLISTWWDGVFERKAPLQGECDFIPFLDKERGVSRPAILGCVLKWAALSEDPVLEGRVIERWLLSKLN